MFDLARENFRAKKGLAANDQLRPESVKDIIILDYFCYKIEKQSVNLKNISNFFLITIEGII